MMKITTIIKFLSAIAVIAMFVFLYNPIDEESIKGQLKKAFFIDSAQRKPIPSFTLTDYNGKQFSQDNFKHRWSLVFFGFSHCPDVCPTELMMLNQVVKKLATADSTISVQVVFISVDGYRDTPERMKTYTQFFNPKFIGVSGDENALKAITKPLGVYYEFSYTDSDNKTHNVPTYDALPEQFRNSYLINHTAAIYLINANAEMNAVFQTPHNAETIASDVRLIIGN